MINRQMYINPYIQFTGSDQDTDIASADEHQVSRDLKDITIYSSKIAVLVAFRASSLSDISLKKHLIPLAKELKIKHRSMSKYEIVIPLAKVLFEQKYLIPRENEECNYLHLSRKSVKLVKKLSCDAKANKPVAEKEPEDNGEDESSGSDDEDPFEL